MNPYALGPIARADLANIYRFTKRRWGDVQADTYLEALFARFRQIAEGQARSRSFSHDGVDGYRCTCEEHFIYWHRLPEGKVGIVTILHQHMVQADRVRRAFNRSD